MDECYVDVRTFVRNVLTKAVTLGVMPKLRNLKCSALATVLTRVVARYTCRGEPNSMEKFYMLMNVVMNCSNLPIYGLSFSGLKFLGRRRITMVMV